MVRLVLLLSLALGAVACHSGKPPEMTVLGVRDAARHEVVFVQVTNPANRPMRLTKLEEELLGAIELNAAAVAAQS